jgi:hypothetical protein
VTTLATQGVGGEFWQERCPKSGAPSRPSPQEMNQRNSFDITDRDGWRREFPFDKAIVYIGSDPGDDVCLEPHHGGGVMPRHLQIIAPASGGGAYRMVNLGDADVFVGAAADRSVPARSFANLSDGDTIQVGDFRLVFRSGDAMLTLGPGGRAGALPATFTGAAVTNGGPASGALLAAPTGSGRTSAAIGLRLSLPSAQLAPDRPLLGSILVSNLGDKPGVQFRLEAEGLEPDCYEIGPGPLLFPGAEKAVSLLVRHSKRSAPAAGVHRLVIKASAPDAYPNDSMTLTQEIQVLPYLRHTLRLELPGQAPDRQ